MRLARRLLVIFLCFSWGVGAQGNASDRVRYNGGSVSTNVKPDDWDNRLTVTSDAIALALKDGQNIAIPPKRVTSLSYGQEAHRRVGMAVGLAVISLGIGALSALHKTKLHYIGINYTTPDGKKQGILLQGDKSNYRAILVALQGVTGVPVSVGEKDRNEIPVGVTTQVASDKADRTGLLRCYVSRVENGHTVPGIETLEKWARALGVSMAQLFVGDGESVPRNILPHSKGRPTRLGRGDRNELERLARVAAKIKPKDRTLLMQFARKLAAR